MQYHTNMLRNVRRYLVLIALVAVSLAILADPARATDVMAQRHPDVIEVKVRLSEADTFNFDVTISSPYDTPQRYADAFRVFSKNGELYGERKLVHDHADEQPFTRYLYDVKVPRGIRVVVVQARDKKFGYGGKSIDVLLPGRQ